jgi:hypothetical protein
VSSASPFPSARVLASLSIHAVVRIARRVQSYDDFATTDYVFSSRGAEGGPDHEFTVRIFHDAPTLPIEDYPDSRHPIPKPDPDLSWVADLF